MNDCVRGRDDGVIVDDGGGGGDVTVDGLQWLLLTPSPARTTMGRRFMPLNVEAITPKMGDEIIDASSMTMRSY